MRNLSGAAERIRAALKAAEEGNYLQNGWYSYMDRRDVEAVLDELDHLAEVLNDTKRVAAKVILREHDRISERLVDGPLTTGSGRAQEPASVTSRFPTGFPNDGPIRCGWEGCARCYPLP